MCIQHVTECFYCASVRAAINTLIRKLKLICNRLQKLGLLHAQIANVAVKEGPVDDLICQHILILEVELLPNNILLRLCMPHHQNLRLSHDYQQGGRPRVGE